MTPLAVDVIVAVSVEQHQIGVSVVHPIAVPSATLGTGSRTLIALGFDVSLDRRVGILDQPRCSVTKVLAIASLFYSIKNSTFSRMGLSGALYVSELLGAVLMFIGSIRAITPMGNAEPPSGATA